MSKHYAIITQEGNAVSVHANEFYAALNSKDQNGKPLYFWARQAEENTLIPYCEKYVELINFLHRDDSRISSALDRLTRCRVPGKNGKIVICKGKCSDCDRYRRGERSGLTIVPLEIEKDDETKVMEIADESDVLERIELQELTNHLYRFLEKLKAFDRKVLIALYGINGEDVLSRKECAVQFGKDISTIDRARNRAIAQLKELLSDFADYNF